MVFENSLAYSSALTLPQLSTTAMNRKFRKAEKLMIYERNLE